MNIVSKHSDVEDKVDSTVNDDRFYDFTVKMASESAKRLGSNMKSRAFADECMFKNGDCPTICSMF